MTSAFLGVDGLEPQPGHVPLRVARVRDRHVRDRLDQASAAARDGDGGATMTTMTETTWIELEGAPTIPGLRARRWRDPADYIADGRRHRRRRAGTTASRGRRPPRTSGSRSKVQDGIDAAERHHPRGDRRRARRGGRGLAGRPRRDRHVRDRWSRAAGVPSARDRPGAVPGERPAVGRTCGPRARRDSRGPRELRRGRRDRATRRSSPRPASRPSATSS